jgi:hypothetical protein
MVPYPQSDEDDDQSNGVRVEGDDPRCASDEEVDKPW